MKLIQSVLIIASVILSVGVMASPDFDKLKKEQAACSSKQVTNKCSVMVDSKQQTGQCVDARSYGLICVTR